MTQLLFLASTPYTGSTLASILIGSHPDVATVSELTGVKRDIDVASYPCSCGELLTQCAFFRDIEKRVVARGLAFSYQNFQTRFFEGRRIRRRVLYGSLRNGGAERIRDTLRSMLPSCRRSIAIWRAYNCAMIDAVLESTDKSVFLDASKDPSRIPFLATMEGFELTVLHLVRDVRGYVNSCRKNLNIDVKRAARGWVRLHEDILRIARKSKVPCVTVRYEDICADAASSLRDLYASIGLRSNVEVRFAPECMHVIGNRMRLRPNAEIRLDESWRQELSREDQDLACRIAEKPMRRFGYLS